MNREDCHPFRTAFAIASMVAILGACATANVQPLALRPLDSYRLRGEKQGVLIIVEPHFTEEQVEGVFSAASNLIREGVYPIQLIVNNQGRKEILVKGRRARFVWPGSQGVPSSNAGIVFERIGRSPVAGALLLGIVGVAAAAGVNDGRMAELAVREFKDGHLAKGNVGAGFVYFMPPEGAEIKEGNLQIAVLDTETKEELNFEIPIPPEYFKAKERLPPGSSMVPSRY